MNVKEMVEALSNLKMIELIALTKELRERWGITDTVHPMLTEANKFVEQLENTTNVVDLVLIAPAPDGKIPAIKLIREITNVGLAEGKRLAETPESVIIKGAEYGVAKTAMEKFEAINAKVKMVPTT